jgi:hypothetical protein
MPIIRLILSKITNVFADHQQKRLECSEYAEREIVPSGFRHSNRGKLTENALYADVVRFIPSGSSAIRKLA